MNQDKKISVIIPIYNVEEYLPRCLETIVNQTYRNLEIILVDDGTKDNCGSICEEYAKKDERILVLHKENGGLSDARNYGLKYATGDYVIFIDSDDYIHKKMFEVLMFLAKEKKSDFVQCKFEYCYEGKEITDSELDEKTILESATCLSDYDFQKMYFDDEEMRLHNTVAWNKLIKRELLEGIEFPKGKMHEDEATTFKIAHKANNICSSSLELYYYYVRSGSIMQEFKPKRFDIFEAYSEKTRCFLSWGYRDLAKRMNTHSMRMLCQYKAWAEEAESNCSELLIQKQKVIVELNNCIAENRLIYKIERELFGKHFSFYYWLWSKKKG